MMGDDTKKSSAGTMRIMDPTGTRKTEEQESHTHTMEGRFYHLKGTYHSRSTVPALFFAFKYIHIRVVKKAFTLP